ncbi:LADA_0D10748g1_1 [Lachancea dasiensis]|uniref:AP complex subunit beta n=1 Tax=Lachancea dasiensis TaxID=1072105 RepID=A0A1G4J806_9SACH|nr:LADA_0D10748g1_1 [Lachancea dasiensis]
MSDQRIFSKYRAYEIRNELQQSHSKKHRASATKRKNALKKIVANITLGYSSEMALLFPEILQFWPIEDDFEVKRICHNFVAAMAATKSSHLEEALPLIIGDFKSGSEPLQVLALRTLSSVPITSYLDECLKSSYALLHSNSESEQLKKTAIYAVLNVIQMDSKNAFMVTQLFFQILNNYKERPSVRANALYALDQAQERNADPHSSFLSIETCIELLELLPQLNEWDSARLLDCLTGNYLPVAHSDAHLLIEKTLPQLQHVNTSVVLNAFKFVIYLTNYVDFLKDGLIKQLSGSVMSLLNKPPELEFLVLRNIILLLLGREKPIINVDVSYFFVEFADPIYIKDTKLEVLYLLAKDDNLPQILQELKEYATDIDIQMSRKAIRAVGNLAVKLEQSADDCVSLLLDLLDFEVEYIIQEIVSVFKNVLRRYPGKYAHCVSKLVCFIDSLQEPESRGAMIWIINQYLEHLPNYLELIKNFTDSFPDEALEVQFIILSSVVKLFTKIPMPATEKICIDVLKASTEKLDSPDLRDRAFMYWRLLSISQQQQRSSIDMEAIREIIDGTLPAIALNSSLDPQIVEELELNIGTIASIYLKPVAQVFRLNKTRRLARTAAFNCHREKLDIISDSSLTNSPASTGLIHQSLNRRDSSSPVKKMNDYDRPAETINQLKSKRKSSSPALSLSRKPSLLARRLSIRRPFP